MIEIELRAGESVKIGEVVLHFTNYKRNWAGKPVVFLGIDADRSIRIHRAEIIEEALAGIKPGLSL